MINFILSILPVLLDPPVTLPPPSVLPTPPEGTPAELAANAIAEFTVWLLRIGGFVAFIGAVKFALSIKTEDAREQIQAVLVMVSGFMIVAAVDGLDLFSFGVAGADAEFDSIMAFIGKWVGSVGAITLLIGAIIFALAIRDSNANAKISGLKTMAAGGITSSVAVMLPMFV
jgi:hypothetical protein